MKEGRNRDNKVLLNILSDICTENVPRRNRGGKERGVPKEIRILRNRIKILKRTKRSARSNEKKKRIENAILETERELIKTRQKRKLESERNAIECMKKYPKMFYSIINN